MANDGRLESRTDDVEVGFAAHRDVTPSRDDRDHDASLGELFRRLTGDTTALLRSELELAKSELRETGTLFVADAARIGVATGLGLLGAFALTAFLIIAIGNAFDGRYWLSSLMVGLAMAGGGYVMVQAALRDIKKRGVTPKETLATLREGAQWAKDEARGLKHELTSQTTGATHG